VVLGLEVPPAFFGRRPAVVPGRVGEVGPPDGPDPWAHGASAGRASELGPRTFAASEVLKVADVDQASSALGDGDPHICVVGGSFAGHALSVSSLDVRSGVSSRRAGDSAVATLAVGTLSTTNAIL
jgi:hypothetical protein